jgi:uncharacterized protein with von Willebrand factor type A (vWA) domain
MALKESKGIANQKAKVVLAIDYSGSMDHLYRSGAIDALLERLIPIALTFDDDGEIDVYLFHDRYIKVGTPLKRSNVSEYVQKEIKRYDMGGTNYAPVMQAILEDYQNPTTGSIFGSSIQPADLPTYVIFISDGENGDRRNTETVITEASKHAIFFQCVGIGGAGFGSLQKLDDLRGRTVDNADFFSANSLAAMSDDDLYNKLMNEFPGYLKAARSKGILK